MTLKLQTIICSTRPGRIGPSLAQWFDAYAREHGRFDCDLVDLADFDLPVYDEPVHPAKQQYEKSHTKAWSQCVAAADAYTFVIPEYNGFPPPSLVNALDFVYQEWNYKPCSFVSYGGVSGGLRSVVATKPLVTTLKMMPMVEGVVVQMPWTHVDDNKVFQAERHHQSSATAMLDELHKWALTLKTMR